MDLGPGVIHGHLLPKTSQLHNTKSSEPPHEAHSGIISPGSPPPLRQEIKGGCDSSRRLLCKATQLVVNGRPPGQVHGEV